MLKTETNINEQPYDPRWFIWTIMFLIVTATVLTTYISFSGEDLDVDQSLITQVHKQSQ
jgi:hypothetical protein